MARRPWTLRGPRQSPPRAPARAHRSRARSLRSPAMARLKQHGLERQALACLQQQDAGQHGFADALAGGGLFLIDPQCRARHLRPRAAAPAAPPNRGRQAGASKAGEQRQQQIGLRRRRAARCARPARRWRRAAASAGFHAPAGGIARLLRACSSLLFAAAIHGRAASPCRRRATRAPHRRRNPAISSSGRSAPIGSARSRAMSGIGIALARLGEERRDRRRARLCRRARARHVIKDGAALRVLGQLAIGERGRLLPRACLRPAGRASPSRPAAWRQEGGALGRGQAPLSGTASLDA